MGTRDDIQLRPCPHCGRTPRIVERTEDDYMVTCSCGMMFFLPEEVRNQGIRLFLAGSWNRVAPADEGALHLAAVDGKPIDTKR